MLKKGALRQVNTVTGEVLKQFVSCRKEGWGPNASNKSETPKCSYTIQSLQIGRIAKSEIFLT